MFKRIHVRLYFYGDLLFLLRGTNESPEGSIHLLNCSMKPRLLEMDRSMLAVDPARILSLLGTSQDENYSRELAEEYITRCIDLAEPGGGYLLFKSENKNLKASIEVNGTRLVTGRIVRKLLGNAGEFAFFIATAGSGPENLSRSLIGEGKFLEGYLADLAGSAIVESVSGQLYREVMAYAARNGMKCTNQYNPGYCTWNVEEQQKLFSLFSGGICGVTLSRSSLMSPIKSVSGVIGIGREVEFNPDNCEICPRKECHFRNAR
jgi:hypothetical protein